MSSASPSSARSSLDDSQTIRRALSLVPSVSFYRYQVSFELARRAVYAPRIAQENGVDKVKGEAGEFARRPIKTTSGLTAELFRFAVDIVTAGVAARVAAGVTKRFAERAIGTLTADELLGSGLRVLADTVSVTDAARLAVPFAGTTPPPVDSVLDVYFRANRTRPLEPLVVERVFMSGVTEDLLRYCLVGQGLPGADLRLGDLRVAIRAIATAPEAENFGLVLSRDEAGNVFSADATAATPRDANWLARRAGHRENSPGTQSDGARNVMNEVLRAPTAGLRPTTDQAR